MEKPEKPRTESLIRKSQTSIKSTPVYIGVTWERPTVQTFNAIVADVISLKSILTNSSHLCVVSTAPKFLKRVCASLGVENLGVKDAKPEIWKVYYETESNVPIPDGAVTVYTKKVGNAETKSIQLKSDDARYPSLYNPADHQFLPVSRNPNVQQIPPYTYAPSMGSPTTPLSYLW
jgi:hypothetical protein